MTRRRLRTAFPLAVVTASLGWIACGDADQTTFTRVSVEGGVPEDAADDVLLATADAPFDAPGDAAADADLDAEAGDADAGVITGAIAIATGSAEHPDPLIGYGDHTCAIAGLERSVYCWGANDHGQLGLGTTGAGATTADVLVATKLATDETGLPFAGVDELAAAAWHSCARKGDILFCWGERYSGAQAEPPADPALDRVKPRAIGNFDVKTIAAGGPHTCALKTNGKIVCFGHSYFNELGRARLTDPACTAPFFYDYAAVATHTCSGELLEATSNIANVTGLVAGEIHSCALAGASVHCWGSNVFGQLGVPGTQVGELNAQQVVTDPTLLTKIANVTAIASGGGKHTCALQQGKVLCWGSNAQGQLGVDPQAITQRPSAAAVAGITDATAIGAADGVTCAVRGANGNVWCWGAADGGQLGDAGTGALASFVPIQIRDMNNVAVAGFRAVAPGRRHVCAVKVDGSVWCWGKNDRGQLGNDTTTDSIHPVQVVGLPP